MVRLPRDTALVLIDIQRAIDHPRWGELSPPDYAGRIADLLAGWRAGGHPVVHIRHDSTEPGSTYRPDGPGHGFKPEAMPREGETVIGKSAHSAFIGTGLEAHLEAMGVTTLVVAGVLTQNSVEATVRHGGNLGFRIVVAEDATAASAVVDRQGRLWRAADVHALSLAHLDGEYAAIAPAGELVAAMARWSPRR